MRKVKKMMSMFLILLCTVLFVTIAVMGAFRMNHANQTKIRTDRGIQENTYVEIGGIRQYMQIRGQDQENPVILWVHGGPGFPLTYLSYYYQTGLEKDYTFVCWEQRGCGRTYYENGDGGELAAEQLLSDMDEVVDYCRERFGQERIIIMGQSWGTVLGIRYLNSHADKVAAYIGVGQVVDFSQGKIYAAQCAAKKAEENGNRKDADRLDQLVKQFQSADSVVSMDIPALEEMILTSQKYLKSEGELSGMKQMFIAMTSPEMPWKDARWFLYASSTKNIVDSQKPLMDEMYFQFKIEDYNKDYPVPICFIQGDGDWITPTDLVRDYHLDMTAEHKELIVIEGAGHTPFLDHPDVFCQAVNRFLTKKGV